MSDHAPDWIKFEPARWLVGTAELDALTEFVFFRLCMIAYEQGDPVVKGSDRRNSLRCKVDEQTFTDAVDLLCELEKVVRVGDGVSVPSVQSRLDDAMGRINARRRGAEIARMKRELKSENRSSEEIALIISEKFPDDQTDNQAKNATQTDRHNKTDRQTDTQGALTLDGGDQSDPVAECVSMWNELAAQHSALSKVQSITDKRRSALKARLKEIGGVDGWRVALDKVSQSDFLLGRKGDWSASFDFLLQASSMAKVMEGTYQNKTATAQAGKPSLKDALNRI